MITPPTTGKFKCTIAEYHAFQATGSTSLRVLIDKSPLHFKHNLDNPKPSSPAQSLGNMIHAAALEPKFFKEKMLLRPVFEGRTVKGELTTSMNCKEVKEKAMEFEIKNQDKMILDREEYDNVQGALNAISGSKSASGLISDGHAEESFFWKDAETGVLCKCRPDFLREGHILVDLKTTENCGYRSFQKDFANYGYAVQAAFYLDGVSEVLGKTFDKFTIIAVEKIAPYGILVYEIDEHTIQEGRELYQSALKVLAKCQKFGKYPGYPDEIMPLSLPSWAIKGDL